MHINTVKHSKHTHNQIEPCQTQLQTVPNTVYPFIDLVMQYNSCAAQCAPLNCSIRSNFKAFIHYSSQVNTAIAQNDLIHILIRLQ